jgi:aminoglycoside phosphotransferase family enzyme/predicted kinase
MPSADPQQPDLVRAMLDPDLYRPRPAGVELRETHISWVFLAGDFAYKVKKPLRLPFLDYGTLERRQRMCHEEVRLNRRLAPDYYLGVVAIVQREGRLQLAPDDAADAVEYAVEMRAIPEQLTLERIIHAGSLDDAQIDAIALRLAEFHRQAAEPADPAASVGRLVEALAENHATLREAGGEEVPPSRLLAAERFSDAFLARWRGRLEQRAGGGLIRDGHGDLRAEHVILTDPVQIYDCVEFDPGLREIDVAADLAFLVMDLGRLGCWEQSSRLPLAYRAAGGDPGEEPLLAFLAAYRAWVRAKVACLAPAPATPPAELHRLGHRFAWRARLPFVLFVCGLAASGKTTIASRLADLSGLPQIGADPTRKRLAGLKPTERAGPGHYSEEFNLRTYRALGTDAARLLEQHGGVIVDATGRRRADRDAFRAGLGEVDAPVLFARCTASGAALLSRARERDRAGFERVSDADLEVVRAQIGTFERLQEAPPGSHADIDTEADLDSQLLAVETLLDAWIPEPETAG